MRSRRRWKLTLAYDGTDFCGWERQSQGERTVQGSLEESLERLNGAPVRVQGAGRTDSGVHALGQVAAVDLPEKWRAAELLRALNALTPRDLRVVSVSEAAPDFHPRYGARSKTYFYQLIRGGNPDPFRDRYAHRLPQLPSPAGMRRIAALVGGERDFAAMMAAGSSVRSTVRRVTAIRVRHGRDWMRVFFTADGFLYKMIRNMISLMTAAASGTLSPAQAQEILASLDRNQAPPTFPPQGLFLWMVKYGNDLGSRSSEGGGSGEGDRETDRT
jgi:tRNA pseudouridine38-40 synthase